MLIVINNHNKMLLECHLPKGTKPAVTAGFAKQGKNPSIAENL